MINRTDLTQAIRDAADPSDRAMLVDIWEKEYMDKWALTIHVDDNLTRVIDLGPAVNYTAARMVATARGYSPHVGWVQETGDTAGIVQNCPVCDRFGHLGIDFVLEHWDSLVSEVSAIA